TPKFGDVRPWLPRPNNVSDFFGAGTTLTTVASAQQAGPTENLRVSISRRSTSGFFPTNSLTRQGAALRGDADLTPSLTLGAHLQVNSDAARNRPATGYDPSNTIGDLVTTGRQVDLPALMDHTHTAQIDPREISWNYNGFNNPYFALQDNSNRD